ncbi:hypothetical protein GCM10028771_29650 [Nocardioides marmoraquaticus]
MSTEKAVVTTALVDLAPTVASTELDGACERNPAPPATEAPAPEMAHAPPVAAPPHPVRTVRSKESATSVLAA